MHTHTKSSPSTPPVDPSSSFFCFFPTLESFFCFLNLVRDYTSSSSSLVSRRNPLRRCRSGPPLFSLVKSTRQILSQHVKPSADSCLALLFLLLLLLEVSGGSSPVFFFFLFPTLVTGLRRSLALLLLFKLSHL